MTYVIDRLMMASEFALKKLRALIIIVLMLCFSEQVFSADTNYGIGVVIGNRIQIHFPVDVAEYTIETVISYSSNTSDSTSSIDQTRLSTQFEFAEYSVGIFKKMPVLSNTVLYFGARLGYLSFETSHRQIFSFGVAPLSFSEFYSSTKEHGYIFTPTIGVEYKLASNFSLGVDIGFSYIKYDGDETRGGAIGGTTTSKIDRTEYRSEAIAIARYMF